MEVVVLLFGPAAKAAGADRVGVRLGADRSVEALRSALHAQHASLRDVLSPGCIAVNHAYAPSTAVVGPSDEIALIALVSGG